MAGITATRVSLSKTSHLDGPHNVTEIQIPLPNILHGTRQKERMEEPLADEKRNLGMII